MALINCPECNKEISDKATACPHCGCPIKLQSSKQEEYLCCPKCLSRELHSEHKGFSGGKALVGAVVTGGIGLLAGTIGSRDIQITCLKCGNKFKAGEAKIVKVLDDPTKSQLESKIVEILKSQGALTAVKWYKDEYGCGLAEAKNYVDSITVKYNISPVNSQSGQGCMLPILIAIASTASLLFLI